jgi:LPXTG-motif cell wall-anchored protein
MVVGTAALVIAIVPTLSPDLGASLALGSGTAAAAESAPEATACHDAALARQKTEISADMTVPQFDASLGTLLEVSVPSQAVHLDTDALFENTAQTAISFGAHMDYQVTFTSPAGLGSPAPLTGTVERVPTQTIPAFDGTLDFGGASAVAQPSTARDASAAAVASSDPGVLSAFTDAGSLPFHVATAIGETFMGGGGNVEAQIHTFASASVRVCYRYALPVAPPPTAPPTTAPPEILTEVVTAPPPSTPTLPRTGSGNAVLGAVGIGAVGLGGVLTWRNRRPRPALDGSRA